MNISQKHKKQYIVENSIVTLLFLVAVSEAVFSFSLGVAIFILPFLFLVLFSVIVRLKRQGKWFQPKNYLPKAFRLVIGLFNGAIFLLTMVEVFPIHYVLVLPISVFLIAIINYYFNFRETTE